VTRDALLRVRRGTTQSWDARPAWHVEGATYRRIGVSVKRRVVARSRHAVKRPYAPTPLRRYVSPYADTFPLPRPGDKSQFVFLNEMRMGGNDSHVKSVASTLGGRNYSAEGISNVVSVSLYIQEIHP
jgi:hypothetical protein